jgi:hypothetical protein
MTTVERLIERLRAGFGDRIEIPEELTFNRTRSGIRQKEQGAWSWFITHRGSDRFAGFVPVGELIRAERLVLVRDRLNMRNYEVYDAEDVGTPGYGDLVESR